jgi:ADP-heptose:LPS heptosyltransferase
MHILAIRFSSLGDVVLQTSTISWLRQEFPESKISFLTAKEFTGLLDLHPHLDEVIGMERYRGIKGLFKLRKFILQLQKNNKYDLIIDLHGTTRSFFIKLFLPFVKSISVDKRRLQRSLLVKTKKDLLVNSPSIHSRNICDLSEILGKSFSSSHLSDFINQNRTTIFPMGLTSTPLSYQDDSPPIKGDYIVLSPVASFASKRWPIEYFSKLAQMILEDKDLQSYRVVVLAGPKDDYCEGLKHLESEYQDNDNDYSRFLYLQGKTNLQQTMHYLKYCHLCIGNDTGLNHIAEAQGIPVITIFGPTHESFGFKAHLDQSVNLSVDLKKLDCRPCSTTGKKACKLDKQLCMLQVTPEMVWAQAKSILAEFELRSATKDHSV